MNTEEKLQEITKPIIKFLKENYDPHTTIVITTEHIKIVRDELGIPIKND